MRLDQLQEIMPLCDAAAWFPRLDAAMSEFDINMSKSAAAFLANVAVESNQCRVLVENLNYSAEALCRTWKRYRQPNGNPNDLARILSRRPEAIANNVYADRMGNGDEASGDGWRYRGSGLIQITGKDSQLDAAEHFGIAPEDISDWLRTPEGAARSAARFWAMAGCNERADTGDFDGCCDLINIGHKTERMGDAIGYADRARFYETACAVLGVV